MKGHFLLKLSSIPFILGDLFCTLVQVCSDKASQLKLSLHCCAVLIIDRGLNELGRTQLIENGDYRNMSDKGKPCSSDTGVVHGKVNKKAHCSMFLGPSACPQNSADFPPLSPKVHHFFLSFFCLSHFSLGKFQSQRAFAALDKKFYFNIICYLKLKDRNPDPTQLEITFVLPSLIFPFLKSLFDGGVISY